MVNDDLYYWSVLYFHSHTLCFQFNRIRNNVWLLLLLLFYSHMHCMQHTVPKSGNSGRGLLAAPFFLLFFAILSLCMGYTVFVWPYRLSEDRQTENRRIELYLNHVVNLWNQNQCFYETVINRNIGICNYGPQILTPTSPTPCASTLNSIKLAVIPHDSLTILIQIARYHYHNIPDVHQ